MAVQPHIGGPVPLHDTLQCWLTVLFALAAVQGGLVGRAGHDGVGTKGMAAAVVFGAIDFALGPLVLAAMSIHASGVRATRALHRR